MGENYNLPKSENARVPQCPKEKEEAIKAALNIFCDDSDIADFKEE